jgi:hypothetical protein
VQADVAVRVADWYALAAGHPGAGAVDMTDPALAPSVASFLARVQGGGLVVGLEGAEEDGGYGAVTWRSGVQSGTMPRQWLLAGVSAEGCPLCRRPTVIRLGRTALGHGTRLRETSKTAWLREKHTSNSMKKLT